MSGPTTPGPIASFHLARFPTGRAARIMAGSVLDRRLLAATPGLRFARQLGTGRGSAMGLGADLRRWALFAVLEREGDLEEFLAGSAFARRWHRWADEAYTVRLEPLAAHGTWHGVDPFAGAPSTPDRVSTPGPTGPDEPEDHPVAVLTRATIPLRHWLAFHRAVPPVERWLEGHAGVVAAVGIGERPVGTLATFSLWRSATAMRGFAYAPEGAHHEVISAARRHGWFREDLFARFRPYGEQGTWPSGGRHRTS